MSVCPPSAGPRPGERRVPKLMFSAPTRASRALVPRLDKPDPGRGS